MAAIASCATQSLHCPAASGLRTRNAAAPPAPCTTSGASRRRTASRSATPGPCWPPRTAAAPGTARPARPRRRCTGSPARAPASCYVIARPDTIMVTHDAGAHWAARALPVHVPGLALPGCVIGDPTIPRQRPRAGSGCWTSPAPAPGPVTRSPPRPADTTPIRFPGRRRRARQFPLAHPGRRGHLDPPADPARRGLQRRLQRAVPLPAGVGLLRALRAVLGRRQPARRQP